MKPLTPSEDLLQSLGITEPNEIDLEAIAYYQGAEVKYRHLDGCEARISGVGNKAIISISDSGISRRRQRFSIGHELGHWCYHRGKSFACRKQDIGNYNAASATGEAERLADYYSANLILPLYMFKPIARQYGKHTFNTIFSIANLFEVSKTCTAIRYAEHSHVPSILVCYNQNGRKWFKRHQDVSGKLFPNKQLDHDSTVFDVLYGDRTTSSQTIATGDTWFNWYRADRYEVWEESVKMPNGEVLVLLTWRNEAMLEATSEF